MVARAGVTGTAWVRCGCPPLAGRGEPWCGWRRPPTRAGARPHRGGAPARQRPVHDRRRHDADRAGPPGRPGPAQRRARLGPPKVAGRGRAQADELQESRARIVAASDAARRQIERNLHDGAQQHLVALAVNVRLGPQAGRERPRGVMRDPGPARRGPTRRRPGTAGTCSRHLPALAGRPGHRGSPALGGGSRRAAHRGGGRALARYSPEVEAAVYFCCLEALQNAGKHAGPDATREDPRVGGDRRPRSSRSPTRRGLRVRRPQGRAPAS